jgi:hypothetical protein
VLFDRAEALAEAPAFLAEAGVGDRVELAAGDFREEVPAGGDVYVLSQTLHNWDDEHVRTILLGSVGYALARDTPLTDVLPWRVLEFQRM